MKHNLSKSINSLSLTKMERFNSLKDLVLSLEADFEKFYVKKNAAAGTRVRQGMQTLKDLAQEIRLEVQDIKNSEKEG